MRERIAEYLVGLTTSPEQAAAIIGDLQERDEGRFWRSVAGTVAAGFSRDFAERPWQMVRIGLWGWAATLIFSALIAWAIALWRSRFVNDVPAWEPSVLTVIAVVISPLLMGTEIARRSRGRDLAAGAATVAVSVALHLVATALSSWQEHQIGKPWPGREHATVYLAMESAALMTGTIARRVYENAVTAGRRL